MARAALALAAVLWLAALAPAGPAASLCAGAAAQRCRAAAREEPARLLFGGRLDANRASVASLEVLPGVGPARAGAIAAERCRAPFLGVHDLLRVPGIGPGTLARIAPWIEVAPGARGACEESASGARNEL